MCSPIPIAIIAGTAARLNTSKPSLPIFQRIPAAIAIPVLPGTVRPRPSLCRYSMFITIAGRLRRLQLHQLNNLPNNLQRPHRRLPLHRRRSHPPRLLMRQPQLRRGALKTSNLIAPGIPASRPVPPSGAVERRALSIAELTRCISNMRSFLRAGEIVGIILTRFRIGAAAEAFRFGSAPMVCRSGLP